jgi:hypothetical protein
MIKKLLIILVFLIFAIPVFGADHYFDVDATDDSGAGTIGDPWKTAAKAEAECGNGDTCYFDSADSWTNSGGATVLDLGTASVTYIGDEWGSGTRARLYASEAKDDIHNGVVNLYASNVTFKGFEVDANELNIYGISIGWDTSTDINSITVDNCDVHSVNPASFGYGIIISGWEGSNNTIPPGDGSWVDGVTLSDITIKNTLVHDNDLEGIAVYDSWTQPNNDTDGVLIDNCTIYNNRDGITVVNNSDNVTIQNSDFYANGVGIWTRISGTANCTIDDCGSGDWQNLTIRKNTIHENTGNGITVAAGGVGADNAVDLEMYNNFVYNNDNFDVMVQHSEFEGDVLAFYSNTIYNNVGHSLGIFSITPFSNVIADYPTVDLKNNIIYSTNVRALYNRWAGTTFTFDNNLIFRSSGSGDTHITNVSTNYNRAEVISGWDADAQNTDPLFVSIVSDDFRIESGSDAIDNGTDLSAYFTEDYYETTRPQGSAYDIGAYEYSVTSTGSTISAGTSSTGSTGTSSVWSAN